MLLSGVHCWMLVSCLKRDVEVMGRVDGTQTLKNSLANGDVISSGHSA